jgi:hypothetical protein
VLLYGKKEGENAMAIIMEKDEAHKIIGVDEGGVVDQVEQILK